MTVVHNLTRGKILEKSLENFSRNPVYEQTNERTLAKVLPAWRR